jgi:hypothetical protein
MKTKLGITTETAEGTADETLTCRECGKVKKFSDKKNRLCTTCYARLRYHQKRKLAKQFGIKPSVIAAKPEPTKLESEKAVKVDNTLVELFTELLTLNGKYRQKFAEYNDKIAELKKNLYYWRGEALKRRGEIHAELTKRLGKESAGLDSIDDISESRI